MSKTYLVLGCHNYLSIGASDRDFSYRYENLYKPFLRLLNEYEDIRAVLHHSGVVFEWIESNHPEYFILLRELVKRKQIEMLGGGFYEPIFSVIPNSDKLGQIEKLTTYIRAQFGRRPRGAWIPEMVWEPNLAYTLRNSGMEYTILNDNQFLLSGLGKNEIYRPVIVEDQGKLITVFPNSMELLKTTVAETPQNVIDRIKAISINVDNPVVVLIFNDDYILERMEQTDNEWVIGWVKGFFDEIVKNKDWIEPVLPLLYLKDIYPLQKVYIPESSYREMSYWSLTRERQRNYIIARDDLERIKNGKVFLRGGFFRQFLSKYRDINLIYSRMIHTHLLVNQIRGDKYKKRSAQNELWKGQCNSVYWHGKDSGIYDNQLRKRVYRSFIEAEKVARTGNGFLPSIIVTDFDMDGCMEYLYQGKFINAFVHSVGGMIIELDYFPKAWNYFDSMMRREEPYHNSEVKSRGYDWYIRKSFIDHFMPQSTVSGDFFTMKYVELGDFILRKYKLDSLDRDKKIISLFRTGKLQIDGRKKLFKVEKSFQFKRREIVATYKLNNLTENQLHFSFGVEFNLGLPIVGGTRIVVTDVDNRFFDNDRESEFEINGVKSLTVFDEANEVSMGLSANNTFDLWSSPLYTYSYGKNRLLRIYQATTLVLKWDISITPFGRVTRKISFKINDIK